MLLNETAILPCNVEIPLETDKVTLVIWYKNDSSLPIYSVDMRDRNEPEYANHWSDEKIINGRAYYNLDQRSLIIEHVKSSDEGFYKCRTDFKQSPTKNSEIRLIVVVPIQNITIMEAIPSAELGDHSFVLPATREGSSLTATCIAIGGNPKPRLTWWRNNELLDRTYEVYDDAVRNILWLDSVQRKDADDLLTCQGENSKYMKAVTTVYVNMLLPPEDVKFIGENKKMSAGHQYEIACEAMGSRPPANVTWWKDATSLQGPVRHSVTPDRKSVISILTFTPEEFDSGKILSCEAYNLFVPGARLKDSWTLKVNYAPVISLTLGSNLNSSSIREGMDVYFECNIRADPWITKIRWLHNNKLVTNNASTGVIISNQTLVLQSVTRHSSGYYRCTALNSEGESVSNPFNLDVKYEPVCRLNQQRVFGAERNEEVNITCHVDGNPSPTWFRWSFNNSIMHIVSVNNFINENSSSVITYKPTTEAQYGTLLCSSKNELGPQVVPCVFHVVSAGRPDRPRNCTVVNVTQSWLYVKCLRGFDGGLPQEFICEVSQEWNDKVISNITSKTQPEFRLTGLEAQTSYRIVIYATNVKGRSKESVVLNISTLPNVTSQSRRIVDHSNIFLKSQWGVKLVIIVASIALVFFIIAVILIRILTNKRKTKNRNSNEIRKTQLSQGSLSHSEDDNNPDLIPQSTIMGISCPVLHSISVQTATSDTDLSMVSVWEKSIMNNKVPTLLEANRLEELVWPSAKWPTTMEPIMLVLPETVSIISKQNAETQTPSSPKSRRESAV